MIQAQWEVGEEEGECGLEVELFQHLVQHLLIHLLVPSLPHHYLPNQEGTSTSQDTRTSCELFSCMKILTHLEMLLLIIDSSSLIIITTTHSRSSMWEEGSRVCHLITTDKSW